LDFGLATFYIAMVDVIELERQMKMKDEERGDLKEGEKD
jgi:hypothetical protein